MRKSVILTAISVAVLLFGACQREQDTLAPDGKWAGLDPVDYLTEFDMQAESARTRAEIDFTSGAISWNPGDEVLVYVPASGETAIYGYNGSCFEAVETPLQIGTNEAFAYFPADAYSVSDGQVILTMPASVTSDPGNKLPMGGIIPAGGILSGKERREGTFKSLGSIIWVKLTAVEGKEGTVTCVRIENSSLALTGEAAVSWNEDTPSLGALDGEKAIEVTCFKSLTTSAPAEFFLFVPAGDQQDLSLELTLDEVAGYKSSVEYVRTGTLSLARNMVLPISFDVNGKVPKGISSAADFKAFAEAVNAGASTEEWANYSKKTAAEIKSDATCTTFNGNNFTLNVGSTGYSSARDWAMTNGYPVPGTLVALGADYYK